jgi:hypothetical protein
MAYLMEESLDLPFDGTIIMQMCGIFS